MEQLVYGCLREVVDGMMMHDNHDTYEPIEPIMNYVH